jgi:signal transduction histidine kinase
MRKGALDIKKILIIEDDLSLSNGIVLALKDSELAFVQVQDLRSARSETESAAFDLIILDINLPDGNALDFLIGALVKTSRLESGIIMVNPQRGSLQTLLDAVIAQIRAKAEAKEIAIEAEATEGMAYYDPKWTAEAVYNVIDNAVKYSPRQSVIKIHAIPYELFFRIDITDEGIGIPEEEQSKIFSRFYRSPAVGSQEGVGIGLFLAREILSSGGGYIKVSSKPGQGSTFSIFLPTEKR